MNVSVASQSRRREEKEGFLKVSCTRCSKGLRSQNGGDLVNLYESSVLKISNDIPY